MSTAEMAAMVADCYWGGMFDSVTAVDVLVEATGVARGEAAGLLLSSPAPPHRDARREDDGRWAA